MYSAISGYDGEGNLLEGDKLRAWQNGIKNELVRVLAAHKLRVGQAAYLLRDCASDLTADALQAKVTEME